MSRKFNCPWSAEDHARYLVKFYGTARQAVVKWGTCTLRGSDTEEERVHWRQVYNLLKSKYNDELG